MDTRSTDALRERVARLEVLVGGPTNVEDNNQPVFDQLGTLAEAVERVADQPESSSGRVDDTAEMVISLRAEMEAMRSEMALLRRAVLSQPQQEIADRAAVLPGRLKVPEPMKFGGARSAKDLENFIWELQEYFRAAEIPAHRQVSIASMFLTGDAKLWWRTRTEDGVDAGRPVVETWESMRNELRDQFLPTNTAWVAREALKKLRQAGTVRDYVKQFSSCLLDIKDMSESDKLFNFVSGLQPWAQTELRRQKVQDLQAAMSAADALVELRSATGQGDDRGPRDGKAAGYDRRSSRLRTGEKGKAFPRAEQGNFQGRGQSGCYLCGGPHLKRDCPGNPRGKMTAVQAEEGSDSGEPIRMSTIQLVGALRAERPKQGGLGSSSVPGTSCGRNRSTGVEDPGAGVVKLAALQVFEVSEEGWTTQDGGRLGEFPGGELEMLAEGVSFMQSGEDCGDLVVSAKGCIRVSGMIPRGLQSVGWTVGLVRGKSIFQQGVEALGCSIAIRVEEFLEFANFSRDYFGDCKSELLQKIESKLHTLVREVRQ